jgi:hypothetical protein
MHSTVDPGGTVTAIHGLKRRWIGTTVREGLIRPSAAWFAVGTGCTSAELSRTAAAALYMAIGRARQNELSAAGSWEVLESLLADVDQAPALLVFSYQPTGKEIWRRYLWPGDAGGPTAPYTKVQRAGGTVRFTAERDTRIITISPSRLSSAVRLAHRGRAGVGNERPVALTRVDDRSDSAASPPQSSWLTRVCDSLARQLRTDFVLSATC